jgi:hypothetical protein
MNLHRFTNKPNLLPVLILILAALWWPAPAAGQVGPELAEQIAFAAYKNSQWDIFSFSPDSGLLRQLTNSVAEDTDPAYSPDGSRWLMPPAGITTGMFTCLIWQQEKKPA